LFPEELEDALKIPGIGPYTARAILSIVFNKPHAVLDGNVKRILARYYSYPKPIDDAKSNSEIEIQ
jgi:A/G-specific adenine glycosylase